MSTKQARLIAAVRDAMEAQGVKGVDLARATGHSAGTISMAISGKGQIRDEKWRLICEHLHLDFDEIVADIPAQAEDTDAGEQAIKTAPLPREDYETFCLAVYARKCLEEDIKRGIDMSFNNLRDLVLAIIRRVPDFDAEECAEYIRSLTP